MNAKRFANVTIIILAGIAGIILFNSIVHYGSLVYGKGVKSILVYYIFPFFCMIVFLSLFRLSVETRINISLFLFSSVLVIYSTESYFYFFNRENKTLEEVQAKRVRNKAELLNKKGRVYDTRERLEIIKNMRNRGIAAYPAVGAYHFLTYAREDFSGDFLPLGGISNKTTVHCNENGNFIIYESDEHGFNNPKGVWGSEKLDIALIGDSFAHGNCVDSEKNIAGWIRKYNKKTLNLGMEGSGPLIELAAIKEYLKSFSPKAVIWLFYEGNDLENIIAESKNSILMRYLNHDNSNHGLKKKTEEINKIIEALVEKKIEKKINVAGKHGSRNSPLVNILRLTEIRQRINLRGLSRSAKSADFSTELLKKILLNGKKFVNQWGGKIYFVYLPEWQRYGSPQELKQYLPAWQTRKASELEQKRKNVISTVKQLEISTIDIHEVFLNHTDPLSLFPFRMPVHYNEEGYRLVANTILEKIKDEF